MKTTKTSRLARVLVLALVVCMLSCIMLSTVAFAEESNAAVLASSKGVLQVTMVYTDDYNEELTVSAGTGFLVNDTTLITNHHVVSLSDTDLQTLATLYNKTTVEIKNRLSYKITVTRDVKISATYVNGSPDMDFAILRLSNSIPGKTPLKIRSSSTVAQADLVYSIGFPMTSSLLQSYNTYTSDDVTITNGMVNKIAEGANLYSGATTQYIQTSCNLDYGNSGGPMVDQNGYVIGVCQGVVGSDVTTYYNAVAIDQVTKALDGLDIDYLTAGSTSTTPTEPDVTPTEPEDEPTNAPATDAPATDAPNNDRNNNDDDELDIPEPEDDNTMLILIIAGVAVILVIVIVVVVIAAGGKKKAPAASAHPVGGMAPPPVRPATPPVNSGFAPPPTMPMPNAGETTVLSQGAGETTVLSNNHVSGGSLTRKRNGETINITSDQFVIGRERKSVNYCIADNSSISRNHVRLSVRGGVTYLTDLNAANGTFVNGVKVMPRQEIALKSGDKVTLADEDFEYRA